MPFLTLAGAARRASILILPLALAACDSDSAKRGSGPGSGTTPVISVADASIVEGDAGTTLLNFTVTLSAAAQRAVTVRFQSDDVSASNGVDYQAVAGNLTFTPGERGKTISVTVNGDTLVEPNESFTLTLSAAQNATLGRAQATGTIVTDDTAGLATLFIDNAETVEGDSGVRELRFDVIRGGATGSTVTVTAASRDGSATAGSDYVALAPVQLTFAPNETRRLVAVNVNGDSTPEPDEVFFVDLSAASANALIVDGEGAGVIRDGSDGVSPPPPTISIADAEAPEGDAGPTPLAFSVTLSAPSAQTVTVQFATEGQSATSDDFTGAAGAVTFAPNDTSETVTVQLTGDTTLEQDETFRVVLSEPVNAAIADGIAVGTIRNDDEESGVATFRVNDVTLAEGDSGTTTFSFTVTREGDLAQTVTVQAATADDTATAANGDYQPRSATTLSFAADETSKPFAVSVNGDTAVEADETFRVNLASPSENAMVADGAGDGTITNDDEPAPPVACAADSFCVGVAKRSITPTQAHIDGVTETRFGAPKVQKFNLGGFGINPLQNLPDPFGGFGESLTEPASQRVFSGSRGEEHTFLRAMVMQKTGEAPETVLFLMADAVGAGNVIQQNLKAAVLAAASAAGVTIKPENILFGQTHSHAGADLQGLWGGVPQDWINNVLYKAAAEATTAALATRQPARLTLQQGQNLAFNNYRRPRVNPLADADGTLTLLTATALGEGGAPIGSILQYNAHPTSINEDPRVPHADYIQGAMDWLEDAATGPGGVALYYNGPIADASGSGGRAGCTPAAPDADYGNVRCRGEGMADAAQDFAPRELAPTLAARSVEVILPVTNPAFVVAGGLGAFNRYYDFTQLPAEQIPGIGAQVEAGLIDLPQLTPTARTLVSRITIGGAENGLEIVTIPGEATNTFGQSIRALAATDVMLLGLTQQSFGYIIPEDEFSYVDPSGEAGFLVPFTGYEEFVSLGPLTAPLLRVQGYNVLFDAAPEQNIPDYIRACEDPMSPACIFNVIGQKLDYFQRSQAELCRDNGGPEAFCALLDPDTPLRTLCDQQGFPEGVCSAFGPPPGGPPSDVALAQPAFDALVRGCDLLDPSHCLFPFPSDHFTVAAPAGSPQAAPRGTGRRVDFNVLAMPRNIAGKPIDPTEWNRNDGFSPGQLIATFVPGLAANADGTIPGAPKITDPGASLNVAQAAVVVLEAGSGAPHPVWAEIDLNAGFLLPAEKLAYPNPTQQTRAALLVRPAVNFKEGQRYVVVLKNLRDADNAVLPAQGAFQVCRDGLATTLPPLADRCAALNADDGVFDTLAAAGIARDASLYLAWDFTVASAHNTVGRMKAMRDDAFIEHLGQVEDASGNILALGAAPGFTVDRVTANPQDGIAKRIEGTITVPSYVLPVDPSPAENPALTAVVAEMQAQFPEEFEALFEAFGLASSGSLPPNRLFFDPSDGLNPADPAGSRYGDGLPDSLGTMTTRYMCQIPASATPDTPARPGIYGHGLLDGRQAVTYDGVPDMSREHNFLFCAVDLFGFASGDLPNVASTLVDLSNFAVIPDGSQQGLLNYAFLARLLKHPQGFAAHAAFQSGGREVFDRREVFYDGNSQGGIVGGAAVAVSKDVQRGVLGVVGMNYSTLLTRSVDFDGVFEPGELPPYALPLYLSYQDDLDRDLAFALIQMLWDRSENNGYAHHLSDNSALEGPDNQVLLHPAFADHQVTHWSAHVMARTVDVETADLYQRKPGENATFTFPSKFDFFATRDPDTADFWDLPLVGRDAGAAYDSSGACAASSCRSAKSALIEYDEGRTAIPPIGNVPPRADEFDPHGHPRRTIYGRCQKSHFLHTNGRVIDVRGAPNVGSLAECPALPPPAGPAPAGVPVAAAEGGGGIAGCLLNQDPRLCQAALASLGGLADCSPDESGFNCGYLTLYDAIGVDTAAAALTALLASCADTPAAPACQALRDTGGAPDALPVASESVRRGDLLINPAPALATAAASAEPSPKSVDGDIGDWTGEASRVGGTALFSNGEHVYSDFLFDAFGADDGGDARRLVALGLLGQINSRTERADALQQAGGDQLGVPQPAGSASDHYGDGANREDGADLTEVRWAADANDLYFLARAARLENAANFVVLVLADTDDAQRAGAPFAGLAPGDFDRALILRSSGAQLVNLVNGQALTSPIDVAVNVTDYVNALEARIPRSALARADGTLRVAVMTLRQDGASLIPANVAYRYDEPVTIFSERGQAMSLFAGSVDGFTQALALADLAGGRNETARPGPGYHERQFLSGANISLEGDAENGRLQPYGLFVPTGAALAPLQNRLTFWLHYRGGKAHSGAAWTPRLIHQLGEEQNNIVATPRARGTSTWYTTRAHQDFFEVFADVAGMDLLRQYAEENLPVDHEFGASGLFNVDPARVYLSGYSMGGFATYLFGGLYPDLFAAGYSTSGAVTQGAWTGVGPEPGQPGTEVCGFAAPEEFPEIGGGSPCFIEANGGRANAQLNFRLLDNTRHLPLTIHHGTNDELALTPGAVRMGARLLELEYRHDLTMFLGYEHFTQAIVDEWRDGAEYLNLFARPENPREITYQVVPALVKAVNEVQLDGFNDGAPFAFNPDGAYWVDGLAVRSGADGANPSLVGRIDVISEALPAKTHLAVPRTGANADPDDPYVSTPVTSPGNHSTPYTRTGWDWLETGDALLMNRFSVTLTNLSAATLDVSRMGFAGFPDQAIEGAVESDGAALLTLANMIGDRTLCAGSAGVNVASGATVTASVVAGGNTLALLPGLNQDCADAPNLVADYGTGLTGAVARFFASLHGVVTALLDGEYEIAAARLESALTQLAAAVAADPAPGVDPQETTERALTVNRDVEPVILTGDRLAAWSVPPAVGAPYPYPSGANTTGDPFPAPLGATRDAHNGVILYPVAGSSAPMGADVSRLAAYKYQGGAFVEVPVQVDQRFPYFLANDRSDFAVYSGTDEELSYQWDVERWGDGELDETTANYQGAMPDPVSGLDHDDEVAFMARDAGSEQAPPGAMPLGVDAAAGVQEIVLTDPLLADAPARFIYLALKPVGLRSGFAGQSHYVNYDRDANADQWIDRHFFRDDAVNGLDPDPERLGNSNSGYGPNRGGKVGPGAGYYDQPQNCTGAGAARVCNSSDRFPRDGLTVTTDSYMWRATGRWMIREIAVDNPNQAGVNYGPDLIDRWKGRAFQQSPDSNISVVGFEDEQVNWEANATLLGERCGPVRCMREVWGADSGTNVTKTETFYRDAVSYRYHVRVHPIPPDGLYTSWDYNRGAMVSDDPAVPSGRYFTALRPQGVPVDGINDDVGQVDGFQPVAGQCPTLDGPQPPDASGRCPAFFDAADASFNLPLAFDNWEQVSGKGDSGSLVYIFELKGATSLLSPLSVPYYRDDACLDDGTGDDPVQRPWPGESVNDARVTTAYARMAGKASYSDVTCGEKQGAYGSHGVHSFFTGDTDNAFLFGKPINEIDFQQWQFMVPTAAPANVGDTYANVVRAPLQALVVPRPGAPEVPGDNGGGIAGLFTTFAADLEAMGAAFMQADPFGALDAMRVALFNAGEAFIGLLYESGANGSVAGAAGQIAGASSVGEAAGGLVNDAGELLFGADLSPGFKAGAGVVDMTPDVGYGAGQYADKSPDTPDGEIDPYATHKTQKKSYGVQSRLSARAVVIEGSNGKRIALIKTDNYLAQDLLLRRVGQILDEGRSGISYEQILHHATHNHSSSYSSTLAAGVWVFEDAYDARFFENQARQMARAIELAARNLQPARMGATQIRHTVFKGNVVRPARADDGTPAGYPKEFGDHQVAVLRFENLDGEPIAVWVNHGEHPEGSDGMDLHSADFLGPLERFVEQELGAPLVFSQGDVGSAENSGNDNQRIADDGSVCGTRSDATGCGFGEGVVRDWQHKEFAQTERNVRFLADDIVAAWYSFDGDSDPKTPAPLVPLTREAPVEYLTYWVPGPLSHPYPSVSNCRTEPTVEGDAGAPILGLPDCERPGFPGDNPVSMQVAMIYNTLKQEGVPVPEHYDAPAFGAVEENLRLMLQAFKVGDVLLASCACEVQNDLVLNLESRTNAAENDIYDGFDWACLIPEFKDEPGPNGEWAQACARQLGYFNPGEFSNGLDIAGPDRDPARIAHMRHQVHNDAAGWDAPENALNAPGEAADAALIKGNFTKQEIQAFDVPGFKLPIAIGHAGDYNGYTISYREYMNRDSYRKALTSYGPHTADYMATRLTRMAAVLQGAPSTALVPEVHEPAAVADELRQEALARAIGFASSNAYDGFHAALSDDLGPPAPLAQPADVQRFNAATFRWRGGATAVDNPVVRVQREHALGLWLDEYDMSGEVQTRVQWPEGPQGLLEAHGGQFSWEWTAGFEAYSAFPARLGATPAGNYRFCVSGSSRKNRAALPYAFCSEPFAVQPWSGIPIEDIERIGGDVRFEVGAIGYPRSIAGGPFDEFYLDNGDPNLCNRCSFRPWAAQGQLASAEVVVTRLLGQVQTVTATCTAGVCTADTNLLVGDTARVRAFDQDGNFGERAVP